MPIFESIRQAESAAEQKRADALVEAQTVLENVRIEADAAIARLKAETEAKVILIDANAAKAADAESVRIIRECAEADRKAVALAVKRKDQALRAIMKKVTGA